MVTDTLRLYCSPTGRLELASYSSQYSNGCNKCPRVHSGLGRGDTSGLRGGTLMGGDTWGRKWGGYLIIAKIFCARCARAENRVLQFVNSTAFMGPLRSSRLSFVSVR